jgi:hypothetical protein
MSEDPKLFDAGDYNLFRYCHNDPIDFTDPMGLEQNWAGLAPREVSRMLAEMREAVQQVLRQAAQQRAYATAYSRGNFEGGTSFIGMANFHMAQTQMGIQGRQSPTGFWHGQAGRDGLVPMSSEMKDLMISGLRDGVSDTGNEINKAVWIDPKTGRLMPSTASTGSTPFQGGQMGFPPTPPKGSGLLIAADMHSHTFPPGHRTGNEQPSAHDFRFGNAALVPVGVRSPGGAIYIYRAPVTADPNSSRMLGAVDGPF